MNNNLTVIQHIALCHKLFRTNRSYKLPASIIPMCNNFALTSVIAMMPVFNAHGLDQTWAKLDAARVQEFFDSLSERPIHEEPHLICDTTAEEVAYIASRAEEAALVTAAGSISFLESEARAEEDFVE